MPILTSFRETDFAEKSLRVEVWVISHIADKSLVRSVYKLFFSDLDGPSVNSCVESRDDVKDLRTGADLSLRGYALRSLKRSIGWIDSAGRLIEGKYPGIQQLIDGFSPKKSPKTSPPLASQPFLSLKSLLTVPEPQAIPGSGEQLANSNFKAGVAISIAHNKEPANSGTGKVISGDDNKTEPRLQRNLKDNDNTKPALYTPLKPTNNGKPENKLEGKPDKVAENVQEISIHDHIASTMKLAGALFEMSIMLNEEMSNAPSQKDDNTSSNHIDSDLINEPNPVFRTMKHGEVDIDAVQKVMADFKNRLRDHQDRAQILARVCRRWKEELETRYPMMNRKSAKHNDVDDLLSPRSGQSTAAERAPKRSTTSETDKQSLPAKVRYTGGRSELKPVSKIANHRGDEKTPVELRTTDARSRSTSNTTLNDSKEDGQPNKQQDKFDSDRDGKQPSSRSSSGKNGRGKDDDGFSIFAW